jgi:hypothetical protein
MLISLLLVSLVTPDFDDHLEYFNFIGQIIGKAMYDGILVAPQFANFFLRILLGKSNHGNHLHVTAF